MRIALVVDHPQRDLPGLVLLGHELCAAGATCYLVTMWLQEFDLPALAPDLVVVNALRRSNEDFIRRLQSAGVHTAVLDTEGGLLPSFDFYGTIMGQDESVRNRSLCFLGWGPKLSEWLIEQGYWRREQVVVTGSPRFDLYTPHWREVALASAPDHVDDGPLVVVMGTYTLANPRFRRTDQEIETNIQDLKIDKELLERRLGVEKTAIRELTGLTNRLARTFSDVSFVYRPHPFESVEGYVGMLDDLPNLRLVSSGSSAGWIARATALVGRASTTAVEASLSGVTALEPSWIPVWGPVETHAAMSFPCRSADEVEDGVRRALAGELSPETYISDEGRVLLHEAFFKMDGRAYERASSTLVERFETAPGDVSRRSCGKLAHGMIPGTGQLFLKWLRYRFGLPTDWSFRRMKRSDHPNPWDNSEKAYSVEDVKRLVEAVEHVDAERPHVVVEKARPRTDYCVNHERGRAMALRPG